MIYLLWYFLLSTSVHDIHVGVLDVDVSTHSISLTLKTFIDDLQLACGLVPGQETPKDYNSAEELISRYVLSEISTKVDGVPLALTVHEIIPSQDAVWITIQSDTLHQTIQGADLSLDIAFLTSIYNDQQNIVTVKWNAGKKSAILDNKKTDWSLSLK